MSTPTTVQRIEVCIRCAFQSSHAADSESVQTKYPRQSGLPIAALPGVQFKALREQFDEYGRSGSCS